MATEEGARGSAAAEMATAPRVAVPEGAATEVDGKGRVVVARASAEAGTVAAAKALAAVEREVAAAGLVVAMVAVAALLARPQAGRADSMVVVSGAADLAVAASLVAADSAALAAAVAAA
tara:strand:+ start:421 stop:780 length:360 start_codon:yes stop_codon:yes gene_type:complete